MQLNPTFVALAIAAASIITAVPIPTSIGLTQRPPSDAQSFIDNLVDEDKRGETMQLAAYSELDKQHEDFLERRGVSTSRNMVEAVLPKAPTVEGSRDFFRTELWIGPVSWENLQLGLWKKGREGKIIKEELSPKLPLRNKKRKWMEERPIEQAPDAVKPTDLIPTPNLPPIKTRVEKLRKPDRSQLLRSEGGSKVQIPRPPMVEATQLPRTLPTGQPPALPDKSRSKRYQRLLKQVLRKVGRFLMGPAAPATRY